MMSLKLQAEFYHLQQLKSDGRNYAEEQRYKELRLKHQADKIYLENLKWKADLLHVICSDIVATNNKSLDSLVRGSINKGVKEDGKPYTRNELKTLYDQQLKLVKEELNSLNKKSKSKNSISEKKKIKNQNH